MAILDFIDKEIQREKEYKIYWKRVIIDNVGRLACATCGYLLGRAIVG